MDPTEDADGKKRIALPFTANAGPPHFKQGLLCAYKKKGDAVASVDLHLL